MRRLRTFSSGLNAASRSSISAFNGASIGSNSGQPIRYAACCASNSRIHDAICGTRAGRACTRASTASTNGSTNGIGRRATVAEIIAVSLTSASSSIAMSPDFSACSSMATCDAAVGLRLALPPAAAATASTLVDTSRARFILNMGTTKYEARGRAQQRCTTALAQDGRLGARRMQRATSRSAPRGSISMNCF